MHQKNKTGDQMFAFAKALLLNFLFNIVGVFCSAQISVKQDLLLQQILQADSVVVISHILTSEYALTELPDWNPKDKSMNEKKWKQQHPPVPALFINGHLNRKPVKEFKTLDSTARQALSKLLLMKPGNDSSKQFQCDMPHHAIVIYKNNVQSYIDLCFTCRKIHKSADITLDESYFDTVKWTAVKSFFQSAGIKLFMK
jgi:hypothetical protein